VLGTSRRPSTTTTATTPNAKVATAQATHEYPPAAKPAHETVTNTAQEPVAAIRAFATRYINWRANTVAGQMRELAQRSVGQARSAMELAAANTAQDYELQRGGVANRGTVEAIAALNQRSGQYVVVTRERTTATATTAYQGLRPAWHLALATVVQLTPGHWAVSVWQPVS
jgi:hypothetical protein